MNRFKISAFDERKKLIQQMDGDDRDWKLRLVEQRENAKIQRGLISNKHRLHGFTGVALPKKRSSIPINLSSPTLSPQSSPKFLAAPPLRREIDLPSTG